MSVVKVESLYFDTILPVSYGVNHRVKGGFWLGRTPMLRPPDADVPRGFMIHASLSRKHSFSSFRYRSKPDDSPHFSRHVVEDQWPTDRGRAGRFRDFPQVTDQCERLQSNLVLQRIMVTRTLCQPGISKHFRAPVKPPSLSRSLPY